MLYTHTQHDTQFQVLNVAALIFDLRLLKMVALLFTRVAVRVRASKLYLVEVFGQNTLFESMKVVTCM